MTRAERREQEEAKLRKEERKEKRKRRLWLLAKIVIVLSFVVLGIFYYARFVATTGLVVREYRIEDPLPSSFLGFRIIHFSDLHYGFSENENILETLVEEVNIRKPHLIVFTGDVIDKSYTMTDEEATYLTEALSKLDAEVGKYAVLGEQDDVNIVRPILENSGFKILDNLYEVIYYQGYEPILLMGLDPNHSDFHMTFAYQQQENTSDLYSILLLHEPDVLSQALTYGKVDLALAGHSHNHQIRLPFLEGLETVEGATTYWDMEYQVQNTHLFISGGLGTTNYPFRLFNRPSINFYRFQ